MLTPSCSRVSWGYRAGESGSCGGVTELSYFGFLQKAPPVMVRPIGAGAGSGAGAGAGA